MKESEKDNYYTPDIEDIRVGYECEVEMDRLLYKHSKDWRKTIVEFDGKLYNINHAIKDIATENIRVSYLNKEQIEAEGWREIHDEEYVKDNPSGGVIWFNNNSNNDYVSTFEFRHRGYSNIKFQGECKSINDFRYICKLLKLNI